MDSMTRAILELWRALASGPNMGRLLEAVVRTAEIATGAPFGEILLLGDSWTRLEYQFATPAELSVMKSLRDVIGKNIIGVITRDSANLKLEDLSSVQLHAAHPSLMDISILNVLRLPLIVDGREIGALNLYNKPGGFSVEDSGFLTSFLEQVTSAIEHELLRVKLAKVENRLNGIFEAIADGIIVCDKSGRPALSNRAFREMLFPQGTPNHALSAILPALLAHPDDSGIQEVVLLKPHERIISSSFVRTRDKEGDIQEIILSMRDVTQGKRQDQKFLQLISILVRRLATLAASMRKAKKVSRRLRLQMRIGRIVRNLVRLSEIKAGPLRVEKLPTDTQEIMDAFLPRAKKTLSRHKMVFNLEPPQPNANDSLFADSEAIAQALVSVTGFHAKRLKPGSVMAFLQEAGEKSISFVMKTALDAWKTPPDMRFLDWNECVDWFLGEGNRALSLDLAFVRHILDAHKGAFSCSVEGDKVAFRLTLPRGGF